MQRERHEVPTCGITGPRRVRLAHIGEDARLGQASEPGVGRCWRGWENEGQNGSDCWKQACHQQVWEAKGSLRSGKKKGFRGSVPRSSSL